MTHPIPLAGVIGHPIAHSRSPRLHGFWLSRLGLPGHYVPLDVAPGDLAMVLAALPRAGFLGVNVTTPHKEAALALAHSATERAQRIGAANTLTFRADGGFEADCTDGEGFIANLRQERPDWRADTGPVAVYGAGGAARAVLDALIAAGATEIRLANRTRARADALRDAFGPAIHVVDWADAGAIADGAATLVNTTSLGMSGQPPFDVPLAGMASGALATDVVYAPLDTPFLQAARAAGAGTVDGLGMLLHQAAPGFAHWFGQLPVVDAETRARVLAA
ncbi:shikimate dehydrogenase [Meridianimarinicoccus sp. RP-17]|uniref:shikimate dehydrogenase n=1 Tax=Meridianimarinicoccus zhengii TaxID=2056810 RepID=UPI000DAD0D1E|nr:shikimate dehydrogenase [Phycocomes zhengii]